MYISRYEIIMQIVRSHNPIKNYAHHNISANVSSNFSRNSP